MGKVAVGAGLDAGVTPDDCNCICDDVCTLDLIGFELTVRGCFTAVFGRADAVPLPLVAFVDVADVDEALAFAPPPPLVPSPLYIPALICACV